LISSDIDEDNIKSRKKQVNSALHMIYISFHSIVRILFLFLQYI